MCAAVRARPSLSLRRHRQPSLGKVSCSTFALSIIVTPLVSSAGSDRYVEARRRAPAEVGLAFRIGVELATAGDLVGARRELRVAFAVDSRWRTTLERYAQAGRLVDASVVGFLLDWADGRNETPLAKP